MVIVSKIQKGEVANRFSGSEKALNMSQGLLKNYISLKLDTFDSDSNLYIIY